MRKAWIVALFALALSAQLAIGVGQCLAAGQGVYTQTNLVSDIPGIAANTNANLVNSWGIIHSPTGPWWVNDNGTGVATVFDSTGAPFPSGTPIIVTIPPPAGGVGPSTPTGIIFNGTRDFEVADGEPATFIFVTEDGTISGWNQAVNATNAILKVDRSAVGAGAVYKGAAMALNGGVLNLYVANFRFGTVEVFDADFNLVAMPPGAFNDPTIPAGFAPFNVFNVQGRLVVTYAKQDAAKHDDVAGPGNGFVDIFAPDGSLIMRLKHGPWLNSPWGVALAPADFGQMSNMLLIGNFGSGQIAAFDPLKGTFKNFLKGPKGKPIAIDGLWGLGFGNGGTAGPVNTLFFAAGLNHEADGLFGTLTPAR